MKYYLNTNLEGVDVGTTSVNIDVDVGVNIEVNFGVNIKANVAVSANVGMDARC
jgi:hypothetical protein